MRNIKLIFVAAWIAFPLAALADDTVIFAADESDLKAFDQLLQQQSPESGKVPFGQAVREEAKKLQEQRPEGNSMGSWVREQRRNENAAVNPGSSNRSGEVRAMVSDKKAAQGNEKANEKKGHGRK